MTNNIDDEITYEESLRCPYCGDINCGFDEELDDEFQGCKNSLILKGEGNILKLCER